MTQILDYKLKQFFLGIKSFVMVKIWIIIECPVDAVKIRSRYYTVAKRYAFYFYVQVAKTISYEWAQLTSEIFFRHKNINLYLFTTVKCTFLTSVWNTLFHFTSWYSPLSFWRCITHARFQHYQRLIFKSDSTVSQMP